MSRQAEQDRASPEQQNARGLPRDMSSISGKVFVMTVKPHRVSGVKCRRPRRGPEHQVVLETHAALQSRDHVQLHCPGNFGPSLLHEAWQGDK